MNRPSRVCLSLVLAVATPAAAVSLAHSSRSVWAGVYTEAQAKDGEALYTEHCASCHGDDLAGIEQAPALAGGTFGDNWNGAPLSKIFNQIESMPPKKPKSLTVKQYTDVLAYLLSASAFPAGTTALAAERSALAEITFSTVRPMP